MEISPQGLEADTEVMHFENFEFSREDSESTRPRCGALEIQCSQDWSSDPTKDNATLPDAPGYNRAPKRTSSLEYRRKRRLASFPFPLSASMSIVPTADSPTLDAFPVPASAKTRSPVSDAVSPGATPCVSLRKNLPIQVHGNMTTADQLHKPEKSPAANNVRSATCFSVEQPSYKQSLQSGGESLNFPFADSLGAIPPSGPVLQASNTGTSALPFRKQHLKRQQSMPAIIYRADAPASPPPSTPLPAVPFASVVADGSLMSVHARGASASPKPSFSRREELHHTRSATIDCLNRTGMSILRSNPPSRQTSQKGCSASAIATLAAQLQKMTSPPPTPSPSPLIAPDSAPVAPPVPAETADSSASAGGNGVAALPMTETTEIKASPLPLVTSSVDS